MQNSTSFDGLDHVREMKLEIELCGCVREKKTKNGRLPSVLEGISMVDIELQKG